MKKMKTLFLWIAAFLCMISAAQSGFSQQNLADKLPVDPHVRIGKLSNGMTYYIRQNKKKHAYK